MNVKKVILSDPVNFFLKPKYQELEIEGSLANTEASQLENLAKKQSYRFGIGFRSIDYQGYTVLGLVLNTAKVRYTPNDRPGETLDFHFLFSGSKTERFWKKFQKTFGKVDKSKVSYEDD